MFEPCEICGTFSAHNQNTCGGQLTKDYTKEDKDKLNKEIEELLNLSKAIGYKSKTKPALKYIDLFAGIGGFHYGINKAHLEWECVYSNEWDKYANSVYKKHFGECDNRDIRTVDAKSIPNFDLLCGGFPCQSFSIAGKRGGFNDTRGTLFFEIARIVKQKQPRLLLLENVKGLLSHDEGLTFATIIHTLDELGYDLQWQVLNSKNFGVPQNRERVFIVGHLRGERRPEVFPIFTTNQKDIEQINNPKHSNNRVFLETGIAPTINTMQGGNRQPKIISTQIPQTVKIRKHKVDILLLKKLLKYHKEKSKLTNNQIAEQLNVLQTTVEHWFRNDDCFSIPDSEIWFKLKELLKIETKDFDSSITEFIEQEGKFEKANRVYHSDGLSPTLTKTTADEKIAIPVLTPDRAEKRQNGRRFKTNGEPAFTLTAQDKHGIYDGMAIRRLTPTECMRLQGFPDDWCDTGVNGEIISDSQKYKMAGNAVTTNVITTIIERLII